MNEDYYEVTGKVVQKGRTKDGRATSEYFYNLENELDRKGDLPAVIIYNHFTGEPLKQEWFRDGKRHRENGPAVISITPGANLVRREWWTNDRLDRWDDQPAVVETQIDTGRILRAEFHVVGLLDRPRDKGPAIIEFDRTTGEVSKRQFWEAGKRVRAPRKFQKDSPPQP